VQGQRITGFAATGEIKFEAIGFVLKIHNIDEGLHEKLFERIMYIDKIVSWIEERRSKAKKEKENRKGRA
jgi:hypothetical protein